jgi:hypothetical protein
MRRIPALAALLAALFAPLAAGAAPRESLEVTGLKDALRVASERAVKQTAQPNGFLDNAKIRIRIPGKLWRMGSALRMIGMGPQFDALEAPMNHAAEKAAASAVPVFAEAIQQLSFEDANAVATGRDTADTDYFRMKMTPTLRTTFRPFVDRAIENIGLAKQYDQLVRSYQATPSAVTPQFDLGAYVTDQTLAGLFTVMGEQEAHMRNFPAARTTDALKKVFDH